MSQKEENFKNLLKNNSQIFSKLYRNEELSQSEAKSAANFYIEIVALSPQLILGLKDK
ncbi:MAG TPA: hypothetical protein PLR64_00535 [Candidatus Dojkabacteria bacterium]|nr:hypothetical protein [Candidatus Dojkabacteria bacterium]